MHPLIYYKLTLSLVNVELPTVSIKSTQALGKPTLKKLAINGVNRTLKLSSIPYYLMWYIGTQVSIDPSIRI